VRLRGSGRRRGTELNTVILTVFSGVVTYIVGQLVLKLLIEPVQDLKKTISMVSYTLIERGNVIFNPGVSSTDAMDDTARELRKLASHLRAQLGLIPYYDISARIFSLPCRTNINIAMRNLIGLSNGVHSDPQSLNLSMAEKLCKSLAIPMPE
jgi:hypothetical protein